MDECAIMANTVSISHLFSQRHRPLQRSLTLEFVLTFSFSVTLQCTKEGDFIVVISKDVTLPNINPESIYLYGVDDVCQPVGITSSFIIYMFPVTACGTVQWVRTTTP